MDLRLGLSLSTSSSYYSSHDNMNYTCSSPTNDQIIQSQRLPYDEQQDESDDPQHSSSFSVNQIEEEDEGGIEGWPPVKLRRRRRARQNPTVDNGCRDCEGRLSKSKYVKVKMEGVAIARKIDVTTFHSFQELLQILITMFGIFENFESYKLIYQDREGDWLIAENVAWRNFMDSVQRLKLIRKGSCSMNTTP